MLDHADVVVWFEEGRIAAEGSHRALLSDVPAYRDTVTRGEES
jgi:ABC-type multidrug transport system fused ATPase/permease subunit